MGPPGSDRSEESTLSVRVVRGLIAAAARRGVSRAGFLSAAGLSPEALEGEARLPRAEVYRLCELALDLTQDPALGLRLAPFMGGAPLDPVANLVTHAPSLRDALTALAEFHPLLNDHATSLLVEEGERATLICRRDDDASERVARFTTEVLVRGLFQLVTGFTAGARLERVCFDYPAPDYTAKYARVFGGLERFEQPFTGLVFDRALLDSPPPHRDGDVHEALRVVARRQLQRTRASTIAMRLREWLVQQPPGTRPDMATAARSLGLSERSLRRRLATEQTSYVQVVNGALGLIARRLLIDERRSIQETAFEMGFADARGFHRAFRTWTGTTPHALRQAELGTHS